MSHHLISRRQMLAGTAAAGAVGLTGFPARAEVNWKKYAGTTLEVSLAKGPRGDNLQKYIKEFTELTGIKVESEQVPEQQQRQKCVIELSSGKPSFDVVHLSYHVQKRQFEKAGWLADMSGYLKDPSMTLPDLVESDFSAAGLQYARNDKGQMLSLPWSVDYFILYYNKELFQKKGVEVPKTLDEMAVAAEKLTDPKEGIYGFVGRGLRNANMAMWTNFYLNYGGEFLDAKGNILTDGPEAVEATKLYQRLLTKCAPPGVAGFNWMESMASFTQGRSAMWIDADGWAPPLEDPNASRVVGKVGYTLVPAGPKGKFSSTYGDGVGIAAASKNKEAAYLLCQWVVSRGQGARLLQAGGGVPFRNSIVDDAEVAKGVKTKEWLQSVVDSAKISKLGLPVIIPVAEFRDIVGAALTATLSGADPATELKKAHEQFRPILERSEKA
ncbi:sugar ABC transporter substrate-binding protein [Bradyrhizobium sp. CCBAU 53421]|uniref:ABC transporter substrate-binding protein n=1 Tax=Bradyrhizobium sp. CCBAU 53421 TaxID=1325120 RepID=UPI00188AC22C|nr:sugar ABC transporter substrate-binding protein [Bradyrhizobium sp. CCBAU 53421]QOZ35817.1 sugar ABC transporter substrate-binding protein [Bradyrhizobium sp. CCBAU 53421]